MLNPNFQRKPNAGHGGSDEVKGTKLVILDDISKENWQYATETLQALQEALNNEKPSSVPEEELKAYTRQIKEVQSKKTTKEDKIKKIEEIAIKVGKIDYSTDQLTEMVRSIESKIVTDRYLVSMLPIVFERLNMIKAILASKSEDQNNNNPKKRMLVAEFLNEGEALDKKKDKINWDVISAMFDIQKEPIPYMKCTCGNVFNDVIEVKNTLRKERTAGKVQPNNH